jgi:hypothetical protein
MSDFAKRRSQQHLTDQKGIDLLRKLLPETWVLREYRPDYGLDFAVEVFADTEDETTAVETLGEHFFIQLKSTVSPNIGTLSLYARNNVEKTQEKLSDELVAEIETYRLALETSELVTVERMGIAVPVLLVVADIERESCSFVCLNDYIDKILVPRFDDYRTTQSRTIHIPVENALGSLTGDVALRWYAKRPKLLGAFQRFTYQFAELQSASEEDWLSLAQHFARKISNYDFWDDVEMCKIIGHYRDGLRRFLDGGQPGLISRPNPQDELAPSDKEIHESLLKEDVLVLWRGLSILPKNYEDIWREWFLPTALGHLTSTP